MSAPRHLWSGDWERESAAAAEELARRQARTEKPTAAPRPEPTAPSRPAAAARALAHMRGLRTRPPQMRGRRPRAAARVIAQMRGLRSRGGIVIVAAMLVSGGVAYAAVSALVRSDGGSPARHNGPLAAATTPRVAPAWLGVETMSFPGTAGVMVVNVVPGSPADLAGLQPGDVITEIGSQPVRSPADVESALAGMHAGQQVEIQYDQGPLSRITVEVTLRPRPAHGP